MMNDIIVKSGIYEIVNLLLNRRYVGQSKDLKGRMSVHRGNIFREKHPNPLIDSDLKRFGSLMFVVRIIERCPRKQLNKREQFWIDEMESEYNRCSAGGPKHFYEPEDLIFSEEADPVQEYYFRYQYRPKLIFRDMRNVQGNPVQNSHLVDYVENLPKIISKKELAVIRSRYGIGCKKLAAKDVASQLGLSDKRIYQIERSAIAKIRRKIKLETY